MSEAVQVSGGGDVNINGVRVLTVKRAMAGAVIGDLSDIEQSIVDRGLALLRKMYTKGYKMDAAGAAVHKLIVREASRAR